MAATVEIVVSYQTIQFEIQCTTLYQSKTTQFLMIHSCKQRIRTAFSLFICTKRISFKGRLTILLKCESP
jgi:hypothetical protein